MKRIITQLENKNAAALSCYMLPLLIIVLSILTVSLGISVLLLLTGLAVAASRDSRIRFHYSQAILLLIATVLSMGLIYWVMFGSQTDRFALGDGIDGLVAISMMVVVWGLLLLVFGMVYLYAAVKAAFGQDICVAGIADLAGWVSRDLPDTMMGISQRIRRLAVQFSKGEYRLQDQRGKLLAGVVGIAVIGVLTIHAPGFFLNMPNTDPPLGIRAQAIGAAESFVGFSWGIDAEQVKRLAEGQGWKTGERVSTMTGLSCRGNIDGYPAILQFFFLNDQAYAQRFYQGYITIRNQKPELLYQQFLGILTARHGPAADTGYPPWRSKNTQPDGRGAGVQWETVNEQGEKVTIYLALGYEQNKKDPDSYIPAVLYIRYKNETLYDKIINKT